MPFFDMAPMRYTLQSAVVSEGLHLVLQLPRTQSSCCLDSLIERRGLHHWTTHSGEDLVFLQSCFRTTGTAQHVLPSHFNYVRVCLIWILYGYNWRSFLKILWMDKRKRPNSRERLQSDFFRLRATESRTALTFCGDLPVNFLPLVDNCHFLVDMTCVESYWN